MFVVIRMLDEIKQCFSDWPFNNVPYQPFNLASAVNLNPHLLSELALRDIEVGINETAGLLGGRGWASARLKTVIGERPLPHLDGVFISLVLDAICAIVWAQISGSTTGERYGDRCRIVSLGGVEAWLVEAIFRDSNKGLWLHAGHHPVICDEVCVYWEILPDPFGFPDWQVQPRGEYRLKIVGRDHKSHPWQTHVLYVRVGRYALLGEAAPR